MEPIGKILVAIDPELEHRPALRLASSMAERHGSALEVVDIVPELSWLVRRLLPDSERVQRVLIKSREEELKTMVAPLIRRGLACTSRVLVGRGEVEIIARVQEGGHDLVMRVARCSNSQRSGFFDEVGLQLLRNCPRSVWLVSPKVEARPKHILACVDPSSSREDADAELDQRILELSKVVGALTNARRSVLHAWYLYGDSLLKPRLPAEEFEALVEEARASVEERFGALVKAHGFGLGDKNVHLLYDDAALAITGFARDHKVDLIVMGSVGRSGLQGFTMGNTAEQILSKIRCSVLAIKPASFRTSIKRRE